MFDPNNAENTDLNSILQQFKDLHCKAETGMVDAWLGDGCIFVQLDNQEPERAMSSYMQLPSDFQGLPLVSTWWTREDAINIYSATTDGESDHMSDNQSPNSEDYIIVEMMLSPFAVLLAARARGISLEEANRLGENQDQTFLNDVQQKYKLLVKHELSESPLLELSIKAAAAARGIDMEAAAELSSGQDQSFCYEIADQYDLLAKQSDAAA